MKLEIKHLAPYLPYKIQMMCSKKKRTLTVGGCNFMLASQIKPILRPLSDLTKTLFQFEYGNPKTLEDWINGNCDLGQLKWVLQDIAKEQRQERIMDLPYFVADYLFKYHFDIFGLIEKGLAIDINTIKP